jgi:two-component system sensor histidine kinase UhpB
LIACQIDLDSTQLPSEFALALYRAAQEGITNSLRHGQARHLQLSVNGSKTEVALALVDDGCGLPAEGWQRPGHYGLRWLVERIESLGGELRIAAAQPHGVDLRIRIALPTVIS